MPEDERRGIPSASGIEALSLCPGKHNAEHGLPPLPEKDYTKTGNVVHEAWAGADVDLKDSEEDMVERLKKLEASAIETVFGNEVSMTLIREHRYWFEDRCSGKPDLVAISGEICLILDGKSGRIEVTKAEGNPQLRTLAVAVHSKHPGLRKIVVGILQPWTKFGISLCEYTREDLARAREWLVGVLDAADKPDAPRIPSEKACRYCRAKAVCAEAQYASLLPALELRHQVGPALPKELVRRCSSRTLASFKDTARFALAVYEAADDEIKRRLDAGDEEMAKYYRLKAGAVREVIIDPQKVFERFLELGGTTADFMPSVTLNKGKLKEAIKLSTGSKGKALDSELAAVLAGCTESKQNAPSLERVK